MRANVVVCGQAQFVRSHDRPTKLHVPVEQDVRSIGSDGFDVLGGNN